ncbi:DUF2063 domain-containing protein [Halovulum dunhuangense]|uniref:DUF2063 domain-containing protein n=1 Tax=Halovulum dunhuangense TaxID=1505036 RepID=A0A849L6R1_9RHOB|nr:DNA-binding domain-containing protein [Halovulum dunhuangense]NNU81800.1 DUF2063 domain-containing protein [Halovulum dunhuangense]
MRPDPAHAKGEQAFHAALWSGEAPAGLTAPDRAEVARRFAVYRNNVQHGLSRALAARFPVIEALLGGEFFTAMARVFIGDSPPRDPVLLTWGDGFPGFLDRFPPVAHLPYLGEVATLELARGRAYHAADAPPVPPGALAVPEPETLRLALHPSVALPAFRHPAVRIWQAHQPGAGPAPIAPGPDHALIARAPDLSVIVAPLAPDTHAVLTALAAGAPLGDAAAHGDPTPALTLLLRHGLITGTTHGDAE